MAGLEGSGGSGNFAINAESPSVWWPDLFPGDGLKITTGVNAMGISVDAGSDLQLLGQSAALDQPHHDDRIGTGTLELGGPIEPYTNLTPAMAVKAGTLHAEQAGQRGGRGTRPPPSGWKSATRTPITNTPQPPG